MKSTVQIPDKVQISVNDKEVTVNGPRGELKRDFSDPRFNHEIVLNVSGNEFSASTESERKRIGSMVGTIAGHVKNMANGVTKGYKYTMKIVYTHFPITVTVKGKEIEVKNFLGERGMRNARIMGDTEVKADKESIVITGNSIEDVGQTAANIEHSCKLTRRDRRIFIDGIYMQEKTHA